jgi:hypothetical protein
VAKTDGNFTAQISQTYSVAKIVLLPQKFTTRRRSDPDQIILATEISSLITVRSLIPPYLESF